MIWIGQHHTENAPATGARGKVFTEKTGKESKGHYLIGCGLSSCLIWGKPSWLFVIGGGFSFIFLGAWGLWLRFSFAPVGSPKHESYSNLNGLTAESLQQPLAQNITVLFFWKVNPAPKIWGSAQVFWFTCFPFTTHLFSISGVSLRWDLQGNHKGCCLTTRFRFSDFNFTTI